MEKQVDVELEMLRTLKSPKIIKYHADFEDEKNVYIVLDFMQLGNFATFLNRKSKSYLGNWALRDPRDRIGLVLQRSYCEFAGVFTEAQGSP